MNIKPIPFSDVASMVYAPCWDSSPIPDNKQSVNIDECLYLVPEAQPQTFEMIAEWIPGARPRALRINDAQDVLRLINSQGISHIAFISVTPWGDGVDDNGIVAFFRLIKAVACVARLRLDIITVNSISSPATNAVTHPVDSVYIGLGQTLAQEFSDWDVRCMSLASLTRENLQVAMSSTFPVPNGTPIVVDGSRYWLNTIGPISLTSDGLSRGFCSNGTYLIVGANGGIGGALARYLAKRYQARLVLVGRRPHGEILVNEIEALGGMAVYEQVDLTDMSSVQAMLDRHPDVNGIVHSALVLDDASIVNMSEKSLMAVLHPKVHGTVNLLNAIRARKLDFVILFSSIQSYISNAGQANYTAASVCEDALGGLLRDALMVDTKIINWGFWGTIGIVATDLYRERMSKLQIGSIEPEEGIAIIEQLLVSKVSQITVVKGSEKALRRLRIEPHAPVQLTQHGNRMEIPQAVEGSIGSPLRPIEIVPPFDQESEIVCRNIASSTALQRYARACLAQTTIPSHVVDRHAKLVCALKSIKPSNGPTRDQLLKDFPELVGHVSLLDICLENFPGILSGEIDPLTVIFPDGSFKLVEPIYRDNPLADYFNQIVACIVNNFANRRLGQPIRILEIGAGTGSTAQFVLPMLNDHEASYTFTDLSYAFLNKARSRFSKYPFLRYEIFNIEKPPQNNDLYDVVIATNVIHATSDLPTAVANVRSKIAPGGIFVLNEITSCQDFATLTFGLTEGWWLSEDKHRIPNSPLVTGDSWQLLMEAAGFSDICHHGSTDQQVIVAKVESSEEAPTQKVSAPLAVASIIDVQTLIQTYICSVIADVMQAEAVEIDIDQPFNEYGIDSLIALELLKPFRTDLGYLPTTILFEYSTVARLANYFIDEFGDKVRHAARQRVSDDGPIETASGKESRLVAPINTPPTNVDPYAAVRDLLREIIADTMLFDAAGIDDEAPFMEYGIDSIIALELLKPLRTNFGYLPATLLFEYPSVKRLAAYLTNNHVMLAPVADKAGNKMSAPTKMGTAPDLVAVHKVPAKHPLRADDIAIVGISGQFPDADNVTEFWDNLIAGRECVSQIPAHRWPRASFSNAQSRVGGSYTTVGAFIRDIDAFDNQFFNITPLDSERMDPQERLFLQVAYCAIADGGLVASKMRGSDTGVFVGVMNGSYAWHRPKDTADPVPASLFWSIANRTSYLFDLKGPSMAVDTACSSSLTALHLACQALRSGDCETALVGGVNLIVHPQQFELLCSMHMLSRTDHCKPFGRGADGFVDGEGVCCIVAKRFDDAIRDKDRVYGVIRGTAVNAGGKSNGYSAPNPDAQAKVITRAIQRAGIQPTDISYVEAHGTGTELGDPIEIRGLSSAFAGAPSESVAIGSVKGNIGHLESAAGLTSVIKLLLQLHHRTYVPSINAEEENPHLNLAQTPFRLQKQIQHIAGQEPMIACVSSFGAGGANAHAVLQSGPVSQSAVAASNDGVYIALLSARTEAGLQRQIDALHDWLELHDAHPADISYTLCCARDHFACRVGYVFESTADLLQQLSGDLQELSYGSRGVTDSLPNNAALGAVGSLDRCKAQELVDRFLVNQDVDFYRVFSNRRVISLPGYAFEKPRFWVDSPDSSFCDANDIVRQHNILGVEMAPAAWCLAHYLEETRVSGLSSVTWRNVIRDINHVSVQTEDGRFMLRSLDLKQTHCEGTIVNSVPERTQFELTSFPPNTSILRHKEIYQRFNQMGYRYGRDLQVIRWAKVGDSSVKVLLDVNRDWGYRISPALIDGGLQAAILIPQWRQIADEDEVLVPFYLGEIQIIKIPKNEAVYCLCTATHAKTADRTATCDITFTDAKGNILIAMREVMSVVIKKDKLKVYPKVLSPNSALVETELKKVLVYDLD